MDPDAQPRPLTGEWARRASACHSTALVQKLSVIRNSAASLSRGSANGERTIQRAMHLPASCVEPVIALDVDSADVEPQPPQTPRRRQDRAARAARQVELRRSTGVMIVATTGPDRAEQGRHRGVRALLGAEVSGGSAASTPARTRHRKVALTAGVILAGLLWWFAPWHTASPVTGSADTNADATAIGFTAHSRYVATRSGLSHEGDGGPGPACLSPGRPPASSCVSFGSATGRDLGVRPGSLRGCAASNDVGCVAVVRLAI
jgi:hypothetical protein